jgi:hypothetical protein
MSVVRATSGADALHSGAYGYSKRHRGRRLSTTPRPFFTPHLGEIMAKHNRQSEDAQDDEPWKVPIEDAAREVFTSNESEVDRFIEKEMEDKFRDIVADYLSSGEYSPGEMNDGKRNLCDALDEIAKRFEAFIEDECTRYGDLSDTYEALAPGDGK